MHRVCPYVLLACLDRLTEPSSHRSGTLHMHLIPVGCVGGASRHLSPFRVPWALPYCPQDDKSRYHADPVQGGKRSVGRARMQQSMDGSQYAVYFCIVVSENLL